jgi:hypothetical protein
MAFKMKHLGGSPLHDHSPGHGAWTDWQNTGEARITTKRGEQGGKRGVITTTEQDQKRTARDQMSNENWKKYLKNESPKRKEQRLRNQNKTLKKTSFRPEQQQAIKLDPVGISVKPPMPTADVKIKRPSQETKKIITPPPSRKKKKGIPPGIKKIPGDVVDFVGDVGEDVGQVIGNFGSAVGRGATNIVNNLFGARSIFRTCRACKKRR